MGCKNLIQEKNREELLEDGMERRLKEVRLLRRKLDLGIHPAVVHLSGAE
jgi:hypothetical protein